MCLSINISEDEDRTQVFRTLRPETGYYKGHAIITFKTPEVTGPDDYNGLTIVTGKAQLWSGAAGQPGLVTVMTSTLHYTEQGAIVICSLYILQGLLDLQFQAPTLNSANAVLQSMKAKML